MITNDYFSVPNLGFTDTKLPKEGRFLIDIQLSSTKIKYELYLTGYLLEFIPYISTI